MIRKRIASIVLIIMLICAAGGLTGCASPAKSKGIVTESIPVQQMHPYTVSVRTQGGLESGGVDAANLSNDVLAKAIEDSIVKSGLFKEVLQTQESDYSLNVAIINIAKPIWLSNPTVSMEAAWSLVDTASKDIVMRESIKSGYTVTMGEAFSGLTRLRLAVEGSARENIRMGLTAISKLQLK